MPLIIISTQTTGKVHSLISFHCRSLTASHFSRIRHKPIPLNKKMALIEEDQTSTWRESLSTCSLYCGKAWTIFCKSRVDNSPPSLHKFKLKHVKFYVKQQWLCDLETYYFSQFNSKVQHLENIHFYRTENGNQLQPWALLNLRSFVLWYEVRHLVMQSFTSLICQLVLHSHLKEKRLVMHETYISYMCMAKLKPDWIMIF